MRQLIEKLEKGQTVEFRPTGNSMKGKINSKDLCTIVPTASAEIGDIVLCTVGGRSFLHIVKAIRADGAYQIGNNKGHINGWTRKIHGKCVAVNGNNI